MVRLNHLLPLLPLHPFLNLNRFKPLHLLGLQGLSYPLSAGRLVGSRSFLVAGGEHTLSIVLTGRSFLAGTNGVDAASQGQKGGIKGDGPGDPAINKNGAGKEPTLAGAIGEEEEIGGQVEEEVEEEPEEERKSAMG